jgi:hypothetical protein
MNTTRSTKDTPEIPVLVELDTAIAALSQAPGMEEFQQRLASGLGELVRSLNLPGEPRVKVYIADNPRLIGVRVHGASLVYSTKIMEQLWLAMAPTDLHPLLAIPQLPGSAAPRAVWYQTYIDDLMNASGEADWTLAFDYLAALVTHIIAEQPASLVSRDQVEVFLQDGISQMGHVELAQTQEAIPQLEMLLKLLLDLGVSPSEPSRLLYVYLAGPALERSIADSMEAAFTRLRSNRIEIQIHPQDLPGYFLELVDGELLSVYDEQVDQVIQEVFRYLEEEIFEELGILLPDLVWAPSDKLRPGTISFKINHLSGTPFRALQPDELLVNETVDRLAQEGITSRLMINPTNQQKAAVVAKDQREPLESMGHATWDSPAYLVLALASEIRRLAARLLSLADVEYALAQLESNFPDLVHTVLSLFSFEDITRVLRGLLRERISIKDLRLILETLLQYDSILVDDGTFFLLDERLPVVEKTIPQETGQWSNYLKFIRSRIKEQFRNKFARGTNTLVAYLVDPKIEKRLLKLLSGTSNGDQEGTLSEVEREQILAAFRSEISYLPELVSLPVVITTLDVRPLLQEIVAPEFPELDVVSYAELSADLNIQPVARILLPA